MFCIDDIEGCGWCWEWGVCGGLGAGACPLSDEDVPIGFIMIPDMELYEFSVRPCEYSPLGDVAGGELINGEFIS